MSCWVVPSVAAEFWGIPVQSVLDRIKHGDVIHKRESGFTFVDVAPESPNFQPSKPAVKPLTYTVITPAEIAALSEGNVDCDGDWRAARDGASRMRRAPVRA